MTGEVTSDVAITASWPCVMLEKHNKMAWETKNGNLSYNVCRNIPPCSIKDA